MLEKRNPYKVLGVRNNESREVCKKAYRKLTAKYHPDNGTGDSEKFQEVTEAWNEIEEGCVIEVSSNLYHRDIMRFEEREEY